MLTDLIAPFMGVGGHMSTLCLFELCKSECVCVCVVWSLNEADSNKAE